LIKNNCASFKNVEIKIANALKLINLISFNKIISSLPFNISESLLKKLAFLPFQTASLIASYQTAKRLTNQPSNPFFTKLSFLSYTFFNLKIIIEKISPRAFSPPPKVSSSLIKLTHKSDEAYKKNLNLFVNKRLFQLSLGKPKNIIREAIIDWAKLNNQFVTKNEAKKIINKIQIEPPILETVFENLTNQQIQKLALKITLLSQIFSK